MEQATFEPGAEVHAATAAGYTDPAEKEVPTGSEPAASSRRKEDVSSGIPARRDEQASR